MNWTLKLTAVAAAVQLAAAIPALAEPPSAKALQASRWTKQPDDAAFRKVWPPEAAQQHIGGRVIMRCHVEPSGALSSCRIASDSPAGAGFGAAMLSLAPQYELKPDRVATDAPDGEVTIVGDWFDSDKAADWLRKPTEGDLLAVWPQAAYKRGLGGRAVIDCLVSIQGALFDCVALSETPAGKGFGAAALALTPQFLMRAATLKGQPVVSRINIPINFQSFPPGAGGPPSVGRKMVQPAMAWPEAPSYAEVQEAYPKKARASGLGGRATVNCEFKASGQLWNCDVIAEEPKGQGFGDAAKTLAKHFRAFAKTSDGTSLAGAGVQLPFVFDPAMLTEAKPTVGKPLWAGLPNAEQTEAAFAAVAKGTGQVRVMLSCTVQSGGAVSDCSVTREEPAGQGVGAAALSLAPHFKLTTWSVEGLPTVGETVSIPLRYEGQAKDATPAAKP